MTMTQRKPLSKSGWVLLGAAVVIPIVLVTLHFTGVLDLSFIGSAYLSLMIWASDNGWNALIVGGAHVAIGALLLYGLKSYIIGEKIKTGAVATGGYSPTPTYPSAPAPVPQETEIS